MVNAGTRASAAHSHTVQPVNTLVNKWTVASSVYDVIAELLYLPLMMTSERVIIKRNSLAIGMIDLLISLLLVTTVTTISHASIIVTPLSSSAPPLTHAATRNIWNVHGDSDSSNLFHVSLSPLRQLSCVRSITCAFCVSLQRLLLHFAQHLHKSRVNSVTVAGVDSLNYTKL